MTSNPYYSPEGWDLEVVGSIEDDEPYQFDMLVVWRHADGRLFYAHDAGCSCPSPFEDLTSIDELEAITAESFERFSREANAQPGDANDRVELIAKVRKLVFA